jgi:5-methylcytosine-specific restriction protein A
MVTTHPLKPCTSPGCPARVRGGRCPRHAKLAGQQRTHWRKTYGDDWPRIRLEYLTRNPRCALCGKMASVADHHPRGIHLLNKQRNPNPHADRHLRPLCASCHSQETGRHQPGGWNAR